MGDRPGDIALAWLSKLHFRPLGKRMAEGVSGLSSGLVPPALYVRHRRDSMCGGIVVVRSGPRATPTRQPLFKDLRFSDLRLAQTDLVCELAKLASRAKSEFLI
jgi:hypothetical protein